jgi:hypothetical protein
MMIASDGAEGTSYKQPGVRACMHTYIHTYIPWIHKFVMATIGSGISHKYAYIIQGSYNKQ